MTDEVEEVQQEQTEEPTIEELEARLQETEQELEKAREHISRINSESADRRLKLKQTKQEKQDAEAAAEQYQNQFRQTEETIQELQQRLAKTEARAEVERAISAHGGIRDILAPMLENSATVESDGSVKVAGQDLNEYVASLKERPEMGGAFRGAGHAGAGTRTSEAARGRDVKPSKPRSAMKDSEKAEFIRKHGIEHYNSLPLTGNES